MIEGADLFHETEAIPEVARRPRPHDARVTPVDLKRQIGSEP